MKTQSIALASALLCLGYKLDSIDKEGHYGIFHFSNVPDEVVSDFETFKMVVEPNAFNQHIRSLATAARRQF